MVMMIEEMEDRVKAFWTGIGSFNTPILNIGGLSSMIGNASTLIWTDEYPWQVKLDYPVHSFRNEQFQIADVHILELTTGKHDPRNPNPKAGRRKCWIVKHGDRRVGAEHQSLAIAKVMGRQLHDRLVKGLLDDMHKHAPHFGRF